MKQRRFYCVPGETAMLKLIVVDDEKVTRDSLKEYMPWDELGIGAVETAKNGVVALELAQRFRPDIIITDVRMPKMDGIEFAAKVRELLPEVKIIFLSGYSDKEYLKSAIHLKAISYIEKPVNLNEMKNVIRSTAELCLEESERLAETEKLRQSLAESVPLLRQEIAEELVKGNTDIAKLALKYDHPLLKRTGGNPLSAAVAVINWSPSLEDDAKDMLRRSMSEMLCDNTFGDSAAFLAGFGSGERIMIVSGDNTGELLRTMLAKLTELSEDRYSVSFGAGSPVKDHKLLPQSFAEALSAVRRQFYQGVNRIYFPQPEEAGHFEIDKTLYQSFKELLKKEDKQGALELVDRLTGRIAASGDPDTDRVKNIYFHLVLRIFEAARERELIDPAAEDERNYIWHEIDEIKTLSGLSDYIRSSVGAILLRSEPKDAIKRKTHEIMKFIRDNFANKKLSIQMIADNTYLSKTYLCSFFKKSTGKTVNEYIMEIRIEKAKELLKENRVKLYEIATNIGFNDSNYFSAIFKKYVGCTPSEFREKYYV
jgi:two-component system response regulator YesN